MTVPSRRSVYSWVTPRGYTRAGILHPCAPPSSCSAPASAAWSFVPSVAELGDARRYHPHRPGRRLRLRLLEARRHVRAAHRWSRSALPLRGHRQRRVRFRRETITAIDPEARRVTTDAGSHEADILVVALGPDYDLAATPGLAEAGHEFYSDRGRDDGPRGPAHVPRRPGRDRHLRHAVQVPARAQRGRPPPRRSPARAGCPRCRRHQGRGSPFGVPVPPSPEMSSAILPGSRSGDIEFVAGRKVDALDPATHEAVLVGRLAAALRPVPRHPRASRPGRRARLGPGARTAGSRWSRGVPRRASRACTRWAT